MAPRSFPDYPDVKFASEEQKKNFGTLMNKPIVFTRFLDPALLVKLGLTDAMRGFMEGTGTLGLFTMRENTFKDITLEFFSSFTYEPLVDKCVKFRLHNRDYAWRLKEFGEHLNVSYCGERSSPRVDQGITWRAITGLDLPVGNARARINSIHHPVIRIWARLVACTLFARKEVDYLKMHELDMISSFLNVDRGDYYAIRVAHFVATGFAATAAGRVSSICGGGVVTALYKSLFHGFNEDAHEHLIDDEEERRKEGLMTYGYLRSKLRWVIPRSIGARSKYSIWLLGGAQTIVLPVPDNLIAILPLPPLFRCMRSEQDEVEDPPRFLLHVGPISPYLEAAPSTYEMGEGSRRSPSPPVSPRVQRQESPLLPHNIVRGPNRGFPEGYIPYEPEPQPDSWTLESIGNMLTNMDVKQVRASNDFATGLWPFYGNAYQQGFIAPTYPHPGFWPTPPPAMYDVPGGSSMGGPFGGGFGGGSGHFGGASGSGQGRGNDGDGVPHVDLDDDDYDD